MSGIPQVSKSIPGRESTVSKATCVYMLMEHSRKLRAIKYRCYIENKEEGPEHEEEPVEC